jgi:MFS family permease
VLLARLSVAGPIARFLHARAGTIGAVDLGPFVSLLSIVVVIAFLAGMSYASIAIPAQTQLQEELPEDVRGRVFGVLNMLISLAALVPIGLVGPLADVFGVEGIMVGCGVATGLVGVGSILRAHPATRVSAAPRGERAPVDPVTVAETTSLLRTDAVRKRRGEPAAADRADSWRDAAHLVAGPHEDVEDRAPEQRPR